MKTTIFQAPICELEELNNLFIEMTAKNCNQRCKHCYIDFPLSKKVKDFISQDTIKKALNDTTQAPLQWIYLTGAEPMTHPDFNSILRLCLKRTNVCICTNGTFINEKKARFLKRVEDESCYQILFILSLDHYNEQKNDELRGRGSYRQTIYALKNLLKYDFQPVINTTNYYKEPVEKLQEGFSEVFNKIGFCANRENFKINQWHDSASSEDEMTNCECNPDCKNGRILTTKGIYSCPFLSNDHRGRCGSDFSDYAKKTVLETPYCNTCLKNKGQVFSINISD